MTMLMKATGVSFGNSYQAYANRVKGIANAAKYQREVMTYPVYNPGKTDIIGMKVTIYGKAGNDKMFINVVRKVLNLKAES